MTLLLIATTSNDMVQRGNEMCFLAVKPGCRGAMSLYMPAVPCQDLAEVDDKGAGIGPAPQPAARALGAAGQGRAGRRRRSGSDGPQHRDRAPARPRGQAARTQGGRRVALLPAGVACLARRRAGRLSPWSRNASEQLPCGCCAPSDLTGRGHIMHEATDVSVSLSTGPRLLPLRMVST